MSTTLDDDMVEAALGDLDDPAVTERLGAATVLALRLADVLTGPVPQVGPDLYAELQTEFSEGLVLELGSALAVASGWQRFIEAFGIRPDAPGQLRRLG
jgi:alkylhydroperoxidase family enzyme